MNCKNCQTELLPRSGYCSRCGAKVIRNRLTLKNLIGSFSEQFFNYDNKFLQTFLNLFKKPEDVIGNYINGTRKKYVNVISYYAIAITLGGLQFYILNKFFPEAMDLSALAVDESGIELQQQNLTFIQEYQSLLMMLYAPIYAAFSRLVFLKNKKYNYTEHLVIFMYILAQLSIAGTVITITGAILGFSLGNITYFVMLLQVIYSAYCLKRLYELSMQGIILKTLLFLAILLGIFILAIVAGVVFAILNPELAKEMFPQPPPK